MSQTSWCYCLIKWEHLPYLTKQRDNKGDIYERKRMRAVCADIN